MLAGDVLSLADDGSVHRRHIGNVVAAVRPRRAGGAVFGVARGFVLEAADGSLTRLPEVWTGPDGRMNEGGCDPHGRFYCGSMAYDQRPGGGALYRLDADRSVRPVLERVTVSNGLEWSPDGSLAYYARAVMRKAKFSETEVSRCPGRRECRARRGPTEARRQECHVLQVSQQVRRRVGIGRRAPEKMYGSPPVCK